MMMTTSDHDGEALNAIRMANAELKAHKVNWEEVLSGKHKPSNNDDEMADEMVMEMFKRAFANTNPQKGFYQFLLNIEAWYKEKGFLTSAQFTVLRRAAAGQRRA